MRVTGRTRLAGIMGWPVSHSRSPALHNFWLEEQGIDVATQRGEGSKEGMSGDGDELVLYLLGVATLTHVANHAEDAQRSGALQRIQTDFEL